jgi:hypothetical protein
MIQAIPSRPWLVAFVVGMGFFLTLPLTLNTVGLCSKREAYRAVPVESGKFPLMAHQFFEEKGDIDLLIFGASLLRYAVDSDAVRSALSKHLGRPATVVVAGAGWAGYDMQYLLLKELLEHRRTHAIVMALPVGQSDSHFPHILLYRMFRFGDDPSFFQGLTVRERFAVYGEMVLGAPRQALSLLRANRLNQDEIDSSHVDPQTQSGYFGTPFVKDDREPPALAPTSAIYSPLTASNFRIENLRPNSYQMHFIRRMAVLLREQSVQTIIFNVPRDSERGLTQIHERLYWPDVFGPRTKMIGIPTATLFAGIDDRDFHRFYMDEHLNANGRRYYTTAMLPALLSLFTKSSNDSL